MIGIAQKESPDWGRIRAEYIAGGTSYRKLAAKYNVTLTQIAEKAKAEKWVECRKKAANKALTKTIQKTANAAASNAVKFERARSLALDRIIHALERMPEQGGTHLSQTITDDKGRRSKVDYDLPSIVVALERLGGFFDVEQADDPLLEMLRKWDDEAGK